MVMKPDHGECGFSLVEVLLALAVVAIGLTVLLRTVLLGLDLGYHTRELGHGLCLVQEQAALYRVGYQDVLEQQESDTEEEPIAAFRHETRLVQDYQGLQEVEVKVTWGGPDADLEELLLYLYVYEQQGTTER